MYPYVEIYTHDNTAERDRLNVYLYREQFGVLREPQMEIANIKTFKFLLSLEIFFIKFLIWNLMGEHAPTRRTEGLPNPPGKDYQDTKLRRNLCYKAVARRLNLSNIELSIG